ncbi:MAG: holo-[acyl-carrier-protein] synthase [Candidatus Margulisiibacteriota bacterium]|nr:MAG: holo-[acyl-carrier-protein] synthase [Candidatus Margulisbacteria bacterium GWD2_39_127]OGI02006.1 MAG: holo-[acyl-carrier-protein] synthase [Candidatus Margulisbacteria bacterium GWF2_38_17]OGI11401.1 MAG: holo-[acyl-carrier-protein] synthase [Candidatus Margulisbacteria bacterium GWE2_39_32]PZM83236.1 MAG: holo-[acyl-carrier-protein] synthase [Candidatus Margulisiibacteriota bacterium]HAR62459.1 holo-[acyl-carrier-protein] synthase [Candidatus Margulisiibacteriota bacterium]
MIGIDIVEVSRIKKIIDAYGDKFLKKVFSAGEIKYSTVSPEMQYQRFAVRFAAKEAVVKALGTGFRTITWKDIEIVKNDMDKPLVKLSEKASTFCEQQGIKNIHVSLSHTRNYAVANVLLEKSYQGLSQ